TLLPKIEQKSSNTICRPASSLKYTDLLDFQVGFYASYYLDRLDKAPAGNPEILSSPARDPIKLAPNNLWAAVESNNLFYYRTTWRRQLRRYESKLVKSFYKFSDGVYFFEVALLTNG